MIFGWHLILTLERIGTNVCDSISEGIFSSMIRTFTDFLWKLTHLTCYASLIFTILSLSIKCINKCYTRDCITSCKYSTLVKNTPIVYFREYAINLTFHYGRERYTAAIWSFPRMFIIDVCAKNRRKLKNSTRFCVTRPNLHKCQARETEVALRLICTSESNELCNVYHAQECKFATEKRQWHLSVVRATYFLIVKWETSSPRHDTFKIDGQ